MCLPKAVRLSLWVSLWFIQKDSESELVCYRLMNTGVKVFCLRALTPKLRLYHFKGMLALCLGMGE